MRWFRDHIRNGAWLALIALAINLALAFGHVHAPDIGRAERGLLATTQTLPDGNQRQGHPVDSQADYLCPICMAAGALANAVAATPPVLQVELAYAPIDRAIPPALGLIRPQHSAFQSRGPPLS